MFDSGFQLTESTLDSILCYCYNLSDHNGHSVNQTLANVSMATYKYLQRHNLLPTKQAGAAATMPSVQEENEPGPNHILDKNFYILKTRPRLP